MIRWLIQSVVDHPDLTAGRPPAGLLTPHELAHYNGYYSPRRQRDWLLGRWTAKRLTQSYFAATAGFHPAFTCFTIAQDAGGVPYLAADDPAMTSSQTSSQSASQTLPRVPLCLSISHSHGYAFCAVSPEQSAATRLGADIELVEARSPSFVNDFFTPDEQRQLGPTPPALYELMVNATWSAKEAALKATHRGLRADPLGVQCFLRPEFARHWTPFALEVAPALRAATPAQAFRGWWRVIDNRLRPYSCFVLTLVAQAAQL
jgi:4'-phosphopantetheinyl transferase